MISVSYHFSFLNSSTQQQTKKRKKEKGKKHLHRNNLHRSSFNASLILHQACSSNRYDIKTLSSTNPIRIRVRVVLFARWLNEKAKCKVIKNITFVLEY